MGYLIADDKFYVLDREGFTFAASWSPMNRPSFILIGPKRNSMVVWAYLKL